MKLLYATTNPAKLSHMKEILAELDIEIIGLSELGVNINVNEEGSTPLENAIIKAKTYYNATKMPCFSADSGLYIDGLSAACQPSVYVRRVSGKYLNDEEMIEHYQNIALKLGGKAKAKFKNALCLIVDENNIITYDGDDIADHFLLTSQVHPKRKVGFPLDSIAIDIPTGRYFVDSAERLENEIKLKKGLQRFFKQIRIK